ncbi:hypothetical protein M514_03376 [Trichuris suis]|uniref:Uncharacterized protein n=1 Tax=Trichuris suis TaxID=68888 RepID=A0A085NEZ4_9BILA|nr:hypothetical protein M513_03376 [Trichuris suis]KFD68040.1 hypothetical protein M514_03376 [Trichuris suis]
MKEFYMNVRRDLPKKEIANVPQTFRQGMMIKLDSFEHCYVSAKKHLMLYSEVSIKYGICAKEEQNTGASSARASDRSFNCNPTDGSRLILGRDDQ